MKRKVSGLTWKNSSEIHSKMTLLQSVCVSVEPGRRWGIQIAAAQQSGADRPWGKSRGRGAHSGRIWERRRVKEQGQVRTSNGCWSYKMSVSDESGTRLISHSGFVRLKTTMMTNWLKNMSPRCVRGIFHICLFESVPRYTGVRPYMCHVVRFTTAAARTPSWPSSSTRLKRVLLVRTSVWSRWALGRYLHAQTHTRAQAH